MVDRFTVRIVVGLDGAKDRLQAIEAAWTEAQQAFCKSAGLGTASYDLLGAGGKQITRATLRELWDALSTHDVEPSTMHLWQHVESGNDAGLYLLSGFVSFGRKRLELELKVTGLQRLSAELTSRQVRDRVSSSKKLRRIAPGTAVELKSTLTRSHDNPEDKVLASPEQPQAPTAPKRTWIAWLQDTWRDHTVALVVGIIASLIATGLVAIWGLTS